MPNLQPRQFGSYPEPKNKRAAPRTLYGDTIDARGRLQAAVRAGADAETPSWLQRSHGG